MAFGFINSTTVYSAAKILADTVTTTTSAGVNAISNFDYTNSTVLYEGAKNVTEALTTAARENPQVSMGLAFVGSLTLMYGLHRCLAPTDQKEHHTSSSNQKKKKRP